MTHGDACIPPAHATPRRGAPPFGVINSLQFLATIGVAAWALTTLVDVRERLARIEARLDATAVAVEKLNSTLER